MKIHGLQGCHLSYCTNIHPGESWLEVKASLQQHLPLVKKRICADEPFGVGLRLSALAAAELSSNGEELKQFKTWLDQENLYVFTLNGFPFGTFHGAAIKEQVYLPDWSDKTRLVYSKQLAHLLAYLLPEGESGSISTVPVGFKANFNTREKLDAARENLLAFVGFLFELETRTGKHIALALEPEPGCYLENTQGTVDFFKNELFSESALAILQSYKLPFESCNQTTLTRYLGVCVDTCHAAVMFEDPLKMARELRQAGISIPKIQLTAALKVDLQQVQSLSYLQAYAEGNYLHQSCVANKNGEIDFYLDLPETLERIKTKNNLVELRSHFHVPVFVDKLEGLSTTQAELYNFIQSLPGEHFTKHFEVETYTFDVLPENLLKDRVDESISRELSWVLEALK